MERQGGEGHLCGWPVGLGGKGNEGVAGLVKQTPELFRICGTYLRDPDHMPYGNVQNSSGTFTEGRPG